MTEASSRRPRELLEEIEERVRAEEAPPRLLLKISKQDIFDKTMAEWLKSLKKKGIHHVTPLQLKRKAVQVCFNIDLVYDRLSDDWIRKLEALGLKLQAKKKKEEDAKTKRIDSPSEDSDPKPAPEEASKTVKKLVDLTKSSPPPFWLENYAKGIILPRMLTIHSTGDANILFYDYNPKLKDELGQDFVMKKRKRHTGHKLLSFES